MSKTVQNINSEILSWAREQAGFSLEEAARALGFSDSVRSTAVEKLTTLEIGDKLPTRPQLLKIANTYRRPLTTFYLQQPPSIAERGADFRQLPQPLDPRDKGLLDALLRNITARQDMVRAILEDDDDMKPLEFVNSMRINTPIQDAAQKIRSFLQMDENPLRGINDATKMFSELRKRIEAQGVFVLLVGNLGSHHTNISEKIFRGFAVADNLAPFIVINDQDAQTARSFTLIHELAHLFVGSTGISGSPIADTPRTQIERTEQFCNDVASEFLLPTEAIAQVAQMETVEQASDVIQEIARAHNVSEYLVAYRFWRSSKITRIIFRELSSNYAARWQALKVRQRAENRENDGSGPTYYIVRRHRIGNALLELVGRTMRGGELTHTKAAKLLGTKVSSVEPMLSAIKAISGTYIPDGRV